MKSDSQLENSRFVVRPWHLAALFGGLVLLFLVTTIFEYRYRKEEIGHMMREEALLLIDAMTEGAGQSLAGYRQAQSIRADALIGKLRLAGMVAGERRLSADASGSFATWAELHSFILFDRQGRVTHSYPSVASGVLQELQVGFGQVFSGQLESDWFIDRSSAPGEPPVLAAAVRLSDGRVAIGSIDATEILEFRRSIGIGKLVRSIAAGTTGIDYIIWQDSTAVLAATPNVREIESIGEEPFLSGSLGKSDASTRMHNFDGRTVFEVVKPFSYDGKPAGLFRIGLKTDHFEGAVRRLRTRMAMIAGLLTIAAVAVFSLAVTRRKEAVMNVAYQRARTFSSAVLESMADAVVAVDADMRVTLTNGAAERILRRMDGIMQGSDVADVLSVPSVELIREVLAGKGGVLHREFETVIGGLNRVLAIHCSLMQDAEGLVDGAVCVLHDLTEQRAMQQLAERREKLSAMGELASGVAHEIRNPLNAIGILAQRLDIEFTPDSGEEEYRHLVRSIVSEVHRVNSIVTRFLKFATPQPQNLENLSLDSFVGDYLPMLKGEAEAAGIQCTARIRSGVMVSVDREQLRQVLLNLVQNAVEATPSGGTISISVFREMRRAVIEIADTGRGIPASQLSKIFDLYYTTRENGTGMGLAIANRIVQTHGGTITVTSREHEGSRFRISLPLA